MKTAEQSSVSGPAPFSRPWLLCPVILRKGLWCVYSLSLEVTDPVTHSYTYSAWSSPSDLTVNYLYYLLKLLFYYKKFE